LYEKNNNFDNILLKFKHELPEITLRDFILKSSLEKLNKLQNKHQKLKNQFYLAKSTLQNNYNILKKDKTDEKKLLSLQEDLEYFNEYEENIEKTGQNLIESINELNKKYEEYKDEVFTKHLFTIGTIFIIYFIYKIITLIIYKTINNETYKYLSKILSVIFIFTVLSFLLVRYIEDFLYIITFLSVIAAALTIATREIILNIAGSIYIFFSSVIRVGDRVMVQFETKHTIGDIIDISLLKIKLHEIDDYNNLKEVKNVGRTIYIPNSYIFTKVFYNYSLKKNGIINDLIEFEFDINNDFEKIQNITNDVLENLNIKYKLTFTLNSLKTGIIGTVSYETNYKDSSKLRGDLSIKLLQKYKTHQDIKLKSSKRTTKSKEDDSE
jgi:small-conductance mechanosensitive channel